jgi:hypothetical protein
MDQMLGLLPHDVTSNRLFLASSSAVSLLICENQLGAQDLLAPDAMVAAVVAFLL